MLRQLWYKGDRPVRFRPGLGSHRSLFVTVKLNHRKAPKQLCNDRRGQIDTLLAGADPSTKIHALTDRCGRAVTFGHSFGHSFGHGIGHCAGIAEARALLEKMPAPRRLLAKKRYDKLATTVAPPVAFAAIVFW